MSGRDGGTRVLDLRGGGARAAERIWGVGETAPAWARLGAACTGGWNRRLIARRVAARGSPPSGTSLIVSVGNLALGGTGKTPVVADLARTLARRGLRGVVVTRGYGSRRPGVTEVRLDDLAAGDEARWLAGVEPSWTVLQAPERRLGLAAALARRPAPDVVVLEDGHQSAGAPRHLDAVILDRWSWGPEGVMPLAGAVLPWGPYREGPEGARRAAIWIVELSPGAPPCGEPVFPAPGAGSDARVLGFRRTLAVPGGTGRWVGRPYACLSGIARPRPFEAGCAALLGHEARLAVRCDDHAVYGAQRVCRLVAEGEKAGVEFWLTTAKDAVKLAPRWPSAAPLLVVELALVWLGTKTLPDLVEERLGSSVR